MPITYPYFGSITYIFEILMRGLGREDIIHPKKPSKKTAHLGSLYSPEFVCTPFKITLGTFIESLEAGAYELAFGASQGTCRLGYYYPIQKMILTELGYDFKFITFDWDHPWECVQQFKKISDDYNLTQTICAFRIAWIKSRYIDLVDKLLRYYRALEINKGSSDSIAEQAFRLILEAKGMGNIRKLKKKITNLFQKEIEINRNSNPIKIGVVGEIYVVHEPTLNLDIYRKLNDLGVVCNTHNTVGKLFDIGKKLNPFVREHYKISRKTAKPYLPYNCGGCAQDSIGDTILCKRQGWNGMIHLYPFTCLPEIIARSILPQISKKYGMPVLSLVVDEQTGEAGFQTRLEAFVDLLVRKKDEE